MGWSSKISSSLGAIGSWLRPRPDPNKAAFSLLLELLSPDQLGQYDTYGYFDVTGNVSGRRYRIHVASWMNVEEIDDAGRRVRGLCFLPQGPLPIGDVLLAQKLALDGRP
jgi:hypothetical protein